MIRFDFIRNQQSSTLRRLREIRVPRRLYSAVTALIGAVAIVSGVSLIETYRLHTALTLERQHTDRLATSRAAIVRAHLTYHQLRELIALDERIRQIRGSGSRAAAQLAQVGNRLPAHVWLTAIDSGNGLLIDGEASGLSALSQTVLNLSGDRRTAPVLVNATSFSSNASSHLIRYQLHFDRVRK